MAGGSVGTGPVTNNASLIFNIGDHIIVDNAISGTGTLTKLWSNTLTLTGANTYSGGTTISEGTLQIGNGGTTGSIAGDVTNNSAIKFNRSNSITYAGVISGTGSLEQAGADTLTLTGANTYSGGTTISAGTLQIGDAGTTGAIAGNVTNNAAMVFNRTNTITYSGVISGTGSLEQAGAGTLTLTGANTYSGGTTISAGTLSIGDAGTTGSVAGDVTNNSAIKFNRSNSITYSGVISGTGTLEQAGAGTLTLTGANTYSGGTTISAGTLSIGDAGTTGSIAGDVTNNSAIKFNRSNSITYSGVISGTGTLEQAGAGILTLTGANSYTGGTTITSGTINFASGTLSDSGNIVFAGGTLQYATGNTEDISARIKNSESAIEIDTNGNDVTFASVIDDSNVAGLTKSGEGNLILSAANTYTGTTTISAGTLTAANADAIGTSSLTLESGATFSLSGITSINIAGDWANNGGTFTYLGTTVVLTGSAQTITGNNTFNDLEKTNAGTVYFAEGDTQTVNGILTITGTAGSLTTLSSTGLTRWSIKITNDTYILQYLNVNNSNNTGATIYAPGSTIFNCAGWVGTARPSDTAVEPPPAQVDHATVENSSVVVADIAAELTAIQVPPDIINEIIAYIYDHPAVMEAIINIPPQEGLQIVIENNKIYISA
jgi:autotransporter-associated beta strand protein